MNNLEPKPGSTPTQPKPDRETPQQPGERPRRRTFVQPTFGAAVLFLCLLLSSAVQAQTDRTTTTQQTTAGSGWVMFHDSVGTALNISADRMTQLRDLDKRYEAEYMALGKTPVNSPGYRALTDRRNADIRRILGDEGYNKWNTRYNGAPIDRSSPNQTGTNKKPGEKTKP